MIKVPLERVEAAALCKANNGVLDANICTVRRGSQRVLISVWNPFTKDYPEKHMSEEDFKAVLKIAAMQPHQDWHFYSKEEVNKTAVYKAQALVGKEYVGHDFAINKEGKIITQQFIKEPFGLPFELQPTGKFLPNRPLIGRGGY